MATAHKNTCVPDASPQAATASGPAERGSDRDVPTPENLLQEYTELRERFQRTTNALASATHDLKTPLAILNGYVELLQSEKLGPLSERQREVLRDMQVSGKRLQQFIQDFLTYSALETGGLRMHFDLGDINDCLSEVCRLWSGRFQEKGLALYFLANDKLPNLSLRRSEAGARDLEPAGKFLQVHTAGWDRVVARRAAHVGTASAALPSTAERRRQNVTHPNAVKVSVSDTGPGIPPEFHLEVFDDFFRLPGTENQEGMGLGLAIARRLVQGMGGKIWVESDPGGGCKFSFLIPYKPVPPTAKGKK